MLDKTTLLRGLIHMPKVKNENGIKRYKTFIQNKNKIYKIPLSFMD